ncbi:MAG: hypothetical protein R6T83_02020 [Salinibacter sp.]
MRRTVTLLFSFALLAVLGIGLVGCDESPTSVEDFDIQPSLESPNSVSLVLTEGTADLSLNYQGLDDHPSVETTGNLQAESADQSGSPRNGGEQRWSLSYDGQVEGAVTEQAIVQGQSGSQSVTDTVNVTVSPFLIQSDFSPTFASVADFEDRALSTDNGATAELDSSVVSENSAGVASLRIESPASGTATVERPTSVPNANRFTFLVRPDQSTDFTLTFTFEEETDGGTETHDLDVRVESGSDWSKYNVNLSQISDDFNPVAERAGGNGALQSISMTSDEDVTYYVDEVGFADDDRMVAEVHDFDQTTFEYSFGGVALDSSSDVPEGSDGMTSREVDGGGGGFGYNYGLLFVDADADDMLSFWVKSELEQTGYVFVETTDGNEGGYSFDNGVDVTIPGGNEWTKIEIPLASLGDDPAALLDSGIQNVGFENESSLLIDQIRFEPVD